MLQDMLPTQPNARMIGIRYIGSITAILCINLWPHTWLGMFRWHLCALTCVCVCVPDANSQIESCDRAADLMGSEGGEEFVRARTTSLVIVGRLLNGVESDDFDRPAPIVPKESTVLSKLSNLFL